jgi:hypothetical protein
LSVNTNSAYLRISEFARWFIIYNIAARSFGRAVLFKSHSH